MPMVMEGTPVITSAVKRTAAAILPSDSARNSPQSRPRGTVTAVAMNPISAVPTMAFHTPPPGMPSGSVGLVKKSAFQAGSPLITT